MTGTEDLPAPPVPPPRTRSQRAPSTASRASSASLAVSAEEGSPDAEQPPALVDRIASLRQRLGLRDAPETRAPPLEVSPARSAGSVGTSLATETESDDDDALSFDGESEKSSTLGPAPDMGHGALASVPEDPADADAPAGAPGSRGSDGGSLPRTRPPHPHPAITVKTDVAVELAPSSQDSANRSSNPSDLAPTGISSSAPSDPVATPTTHSSPLAPAISPAMLAWQQILATEAGAELADLVPRLSVDPLTSSFPVFPMIPHFLDSLVGSLPHDAWDLVDGPGDGLGGSAEEGDPLAKLRDSKIRRDHVMKEIYETEVSYLGKLQIMDRVFRAQLRRILGEAGEPSIRRIFGGLDELLAIHTEFRSRLRSLCLSWTDESGVGDLFREFKPKLTQGYAVYIDNFQSCRDEMNNLDRTNSEYRQFTKDCMTSPETEKTNLAEFLLYPVQRTTRYTLLLKEMVKSTPKTHPDYASVLAAQKDMEEWTNRVNELKRLEEERTAMFQAFSQTENCPASLINFNRRLVFQADATDGKTGKPLHVFLFSDLIMVAKPIQKGGIWFLAAAGPAAEGDKLYKFVRWLDFRDFAVADDTLTKSNRAQIRLLLRYRRADNPMSVTTFPGAEEKPAQANETLAYTFGTDEERDKFVAALQSEMKRGKKI